MKEKRVWAKARKIIKDNTTWKEKDWVYDLARKRTLKEVKQFIEHERDMGNLIGEKGFSAGICLSDLLNWLEKELK